MARAGAVLVATLHQLQSRIRPGVSTGELDAVAERFIRSRGAIPTFKGYRGFPASICASPNAMIVHGIPGPDRLKGGDIISVDVGVTLDGWVADAARTFPVGEIDEPATRVIDADGCVQHLDLSHGESHAAELYPRPGRAARSAVHARGSGRRLSELPQEPGQVRAPAAGLRRPKRYSKNATPSAPTEATLEERAHQDRAAVGAGVGRAGERQGVLKGALR